MRDFEPDDLTTFIVETSKAVMVFEEIGHTEPT